jgi:hypothetical protein
MHGVQEGLWTKARQKWTLIRDSSPLHARGNIQTSTKINSRRPANSVLCPAEDDAGGYVPNVNYTAKEKAWEEAREISRERDAVSR